MFNVILRFLSFTAYLLFFFVIPLSLLWDWTGFAIGLVLFSLFLVGLKYRAFEKIQKRLRAEPLFLTEAPVLFTLLQEHCRRLEMPVPQVFLIRSDALNSATFGFSQERSALVVTEGLLVRLSREQLSALLCRQLLTIWHREILGASWLAQFLALIDWATLSRRQGGFSHFLKRVVFYPLALFPAYILESGRSPEALDQQSTKVSRRPLELAEALRMLEALQERNPLFVRFSLRHLFLVTPSSIDPIVGVLFKSTRLKTRIRALQIGVA